MNVLSLCDGMSCGQIALKELGIVPEHYYASEIEPNAIKVTQYNFPNTIQLGDVTKITEDFLKTLPKIDLVMFGSPCRSLSTATAGHKGYNDGLKGVSGLFYTCNNILEYIKQHNNPNVYFFVENVNSTKKADIAEMSKLLGVEPQLINSAVFSAQDRKRLYWTNIPVAAMPETCTAVLNDIIDTDVNEKYYYTVPHEYHGDDKRVCATLGINGHDLIKRVYNTAYKSPTLTSCRGGNTQVKVYINGRCRKLTPVEYRRLQTIPDWYKTDNIAHGQVYNICGDGWTIAVVKHIFKGLCKQYAVADIPRDES